MSTLGPPTAYLQSLRRWVMADSQQDLVGVGQQRRDSLLMGGVLHLHAVDSDDAISHAEICPGR